MSDRQCIGLQVPCDQGLYSFRQEHDACGVGMVANLNNVASHEIIEMGLEIMRKLMHRGASGADPETGDGAGLLFALPDAFFRNAVPDKLPAPGRYGVAMMFGGEGDEKLIEQIVLSENSAILHWRKVPADVDKIGRLARESCPCIRQLFLDGRVFADQSNFERTLYVIRRRIEKATRDCYVVSCSSRSIVYKGLLHASQIREFYPDLQDESLVSPMVMVHQRYSTNTFPTWQLAQPFRYLAHNGEINTVRGNLNQLQSREASLKSELLGDDLAKILPLCREAQSDSACLDNLLELLVAGGRSLPHAMMMLIPQAWGAKYYLGRDVRGFFDYHSALMEPWDGPAAVTFSDGVNLGAILDRNGLRPARYTLTKDGLFVLASETGVLDFPPENILRKGRLKPGEILYCDLEHHRLISDAELKNTIARQQPYRRWADENKISVSGLFDSINAAVTDSGLNQRQQLFGWTREDVEMIVKPMAAKGQEPVGSMGNDSALAIFSGQPQLLYNYFKQLFAQVTNPPIDPIREELVMSLTTYIGNPGNILAEFHSPGSLIKMERPVLTDEDLHRLTAGTNQKFSAATLQLAWQDDLEKDLQILCREAVECARKGNNILILSDRNLTPEQIPLPALLGTAAVNRALNQAGLRPTIGLIVQSGEIREIMHYALLLGYGATAIHPYLALECVTMLSQKKAVPQVPSTAAENYIRAVDKGLLKVMSKMGISTLRSYRGAQIFEAVGLDASIIDRFFPGTASRIGGLTLPDLAREARERWQHAADLEEDAILPSGGQYRFRTDGENHLWTPETLSLFRRAVQSNDATSYRAYAETINQQAKSLCTLRGLFEFVPSQPVPLEEVESADTIIRRFVSGAMSLGALSPEAHEAIAVALNQLGAMSNCGEGGEDPNRETPGPHGELRSSAIRQIASGRFGVTLEYLSGAKELQIKMAQGAKPGEGGQLPGYKVDSEIARVRHSLPNVTLISPPPHHDIYSIEDLAQLIYDLRMVNRDARISVKLVSEVGVGTIAAGVAKGHADVILISGHDGGTGASPLTSIKHAGLPWELGLAETQQTLVLNQLRGRVRLQVDGQLKTGRDVIIGALLGADEFGFATTLLVCLGCIMMRKCHENCCPVGVATQDPILRKCFKGKPEYIVNFFRLLAGEVREYLAQLGFRTLEEAIGRSDKLQMKKAVDFYKLRNLDFSKILQNPGGSVRSGRITPQGLCSYDERVLLPQLKKALETGCPAHIKAAICNLDRTVGADISSRLYRRFGRDLLPENMIKVHFTGTAGQSFGAFLARGIQFTLEGEANDFVGKGLSGGTIIIKPPRKARFAANENVIAGNVIGYGGTSGKIFLNGQAGERFAIRNSGFSAVVEGIGDHGCEYMTGGRVVVLGPTGVNFAAGMTGGIAYVYDVANHFDLRCNLDTIDLESITAGSDAETELLTLLHEHLHFTGSRMARELLADWTNQRGHFLKVIPFEYKQALSKC